MIRQQVFAFSLAAALSCSLLVGQPQAGFAASSTKTTTSFSYSSKVVGNTVVITGNSTTASTSKTAPKSNSSKAPATIKPPTTSKTTTSSSVTVKPKASPAPVKKPSGSSSKTQASKTTLSKTTAVTAKPRPKILTAPKSSFSFFSVKKPAAPLVFKAPPKPATKPMVKVITKVISKTVPKQIIPPKKVVVKLPASTGSKISTAKDEVSFTPDQVQAKAFPAAVSVSEPVYLSAPVSVHYRVGTILGQPAQVRFTPIESTWSFSDGSSAKGLNPQRSFASAGTYSASVAVRYLVSYRLAGSSSWITDAGEITLTDQAQIVVASPQGNSPQTSKAPVAERPYLVGENCLTNPSAFAC